MSLYRNSIWFVKGLREYTRGGYEKAAKAFNAADLEVNISERSFMITGGNSGIGRAAAIALAQKGGTIHLVCRNKERGEEAVEDIKGKCGHTRVHLHLLDISKPGDIIKFAREFDESGQPLHVLVNNAGCMINSRELTEDNIEKNFAANTLGTHIMTSSFLPVLKKAYKPRVIIVTSGGMLVQKLDIKDLQFETLKPFDGTMAYAQNKRQQVVMTEQYAQQHGDVHFSCMHPGWADTPAVQTSMPGFHAKMKNKLRTPEEGGDTIVWLAMSDAALDQPSGLFFQDRKAVPTHLPLAWSKSSDEDKKNLMTVLDEMMAKFNQ